MRNFVVELLKALMEVEELREIVPDYLLSAKFKGQEQDEFERLMIDWTDTEYLKDFFEKNSAKLFSGFFKEFKSVNQAVLFTMAEADRLSDLLLSCNEGKELSLDENFKPYHKTSTSIVREESKIYGPTKWGRRNSWLRVYAIRIDSNFYAISGGSIKLAKTTQEMDDYQENTQKFKVLADYIRSKGIECSDDYGYLDIE